MTQTNPLPELAAVETLVTARRTSLLIDTTLPVERTLVERLCHLVVHAPNHKKTWPWRLAVFTGEARAALGAGFADDLVEAGVQVEPAKLDKTRRKYGRAPVVVVVGSAPETDPVRHAENVQAVAAGIQNLLLGAAAAGLAAMWSSPPINRAPRVDALGGWEPGTELVAVVYLGHPSAAPAPVPRPDPSIAWLGDG